MEFAYIVRDLWSKRVWLVALLLVAAVVAVLTSFEVSLSPLSVERERTLRFAAGQTEVLVDTRQSTLDNAGEGIEPLNARASVFARLVRTPPVKDAIAREMRVRNDSITVTGPIDAESSEAVRARPAEARANEIAGELRGLRVFVDVEQRVPIIGFSTQAPTAGEASKLANATATSLISYVETLERLRRAERERQRRRDAAERRRFLAANPGAVLPLQPTNTLQARGVRVVQLGEATAATVSNGSSPTRALLVFLAVFLGGTVLLLIVGRTAAAFRETRPLDDDAVDEHQRAAA